MVGVPTAYLWDTYGLARWEGGLGMGVFLIVGVPPFPGGRFPSAYEAGFLGTSHHNALCNAGITNLVIHLADVPESDKEKKNKTDLHDNRAVAIKKEAVGQ